MRVAKALSCDIVIIFYLFFTVNPHPNQFMVLRRGGITEISVIPPLFNTITQGGGVHGKKKKKITISQLSALATRTPILGARCSRRLGVMSATNKEVPFFE